MDLGNKVKIKVFPIIVNASMTGQIISDVINIENVDNVAIEIDWTTSAAEGTFDVEGSIMGTTWKPLRGLQRIIQSIGASDDGLYDLNQLSFPLLRLVFNPTTPGAGTVNAWVGGKDL